MDDGRGLRAYLGHVLHVGFGYGRLPFNISDLKYGFDVKLNCLFLRDLDYSIDFFHHHVKHIDLALLDLLISLGMLFELFEDEFFLS